MKLREALVASKIKPKILIISGPTASGKTDLSLKLAKELNGEIVNIDSVQIYKHFNIGSAKLPESERGDIPHHLIDILEPNDPFNVATYKELADQLIIDIISRGKTPIFVGGSTLYIKVLLHGLTSEMASNPRLRDELELEDLASLVSELQKLDPELALKIDLQNKRRVVRALESLCSNTKTVSSAHDKHNFQNIDYQALIILTEVEREVLYQKINHRAELMIQLGLIEETAFILKNFGEHCPALKSLGYKETLIYLAREISISELILLVAQNTRRFAKKQLTFWRNEPKKRNWLEIKNNYSNSEDFLLNPASKIMYTGAKESNIEEILCIFDKLRFDSGIQIRIYKAHV